MYYIIIWIIWDGHLTLLLKEKGSGMIYLLVVQQPCPQTKTVGTRDENTSLDKKKCNKWADQAKIHVSNHVSAFPRLRSTITIPCMWLTLWSDSFSPIWQSHHFLMVSNVSVSSTLVHHITMMCVTIMSLCKVLPTHHYNITRAQQFSTYMSRFWSKITKWSTDPKTKRWLHLNLAIIYQFLH